MCFVSFITLFEIRVVLVLRRIVRDIIKTIYWPSRKVLVIIVRFYRNLNVLDRFSKSTNIPNLMKIRPVGVELFHADRRTVGSTDRRDEVSCFSQFWERA
jgi:hypothetical protein